MYKRLAVIHCERMCACLRACMRVGRCECRWVSGVRGISLFSLCAFILVWMFRAMHSCELLYTYLFVLVCSYGYVLHTRLNAGVGTKNYISYRHNT